MRSKSKLEKLEKDLEMSSPYKPMIYVTHIYGEDYCHEKERFSTKEELLSKYPEDKYQLVIINVRYEERGASGQESKA